MYPELKTYQEQETRYTAAEFLDAFIERNVDRIDGVKNWSVTTGSVRA